MATQNAILKKALFLSLFTFAVIPHTAFSQNCENTGCPRIKECCSLWGYCGANDEHCGFWCRSGPCKVPNNRFSSYSLDDGPRGKMESVVTPALFNRIMSKAGSNCTGNGFYTREAFITAVKMFGDYKGSVAKREIGSGNFCYREEITNETYCSASKKYPCESGKKYYGRGLIQSLKWNEYYGAGGKYLGLPLLKDPDMVARSSEVAFKFAMWFWKAKVRPALKQGFGGTISRINGLECGGANREAVENRGKLYLEICKLLGVNPGEDLSC